MSDSEQLHERVTDVLDRADAESGSVLSRSDDDSEDADDDDAAGGVLEAAEDASDIFDSSDPDALLEAVGLDTLPDGSEPSSIPEAIARGEPEQVEDLQRLLSLAKLADRGDDLEGVVGDLRDRIGDDSDGTETDADEDATDDDVGEEGDAAEDEGEDDDAADETESTDDATGTDEDAETAEDSSDATDDLTDRLRSSMESSLGAFSDDVEGLQAKLEEATAGIGSDDSDEDAAAAEDESAAEDAKADESAAADDVEDEDDGLLDPDLGGDQDRGTSSGGATRHSTVAPSPSKRADMRGTARHSTMPDKH